jgi:hypothetical protein
VTLVGLPLQAVNIKININRERNIFFILYI